MKYSSVKKNPFQSFDSNPKKQDKIDSSIRTQSIP